MTRSLIVCRRDLANPESWRESSWVGARTNARGLSALFGGESEEEEVVEADNSEEEEEGPSERRGK